MNVLVNTTLNRENMHIVDSGDQQKIHWFWFGHVESQDRATVKVRRGRNGLAS